MAMDPKTIEIFRQTKKVPFKIQLRLLVCRLLAINQLA